MGMMILKGAELAGGGRMGPIKCGRACPCVVGYSPVQEDVSQCRRACPCVGGVVGCAL